MKVSHNKAALGLLAGVAVLSALFVWRGLATVGDLLGEAGFGLLLVCLFFPPDQWLASESWRVLFRRGQRPGAWPALYASAMGSAVNSLLPVATIGGEIVKARALMLWGQPAAETLAATTVDKTVQAIAVLVWGLIGAAFLAGVVGLTGAVSAVLIGAGALFAGIAGFIVVQLRGGVSLVAGKMAAWAGPEAAAALRQGAALVEQAMRETYRDPGRLAAATALRIGERVILAGEVVLVGYLMGHPVGLLDAIILKGLIGAIRGLAFAVPAGLGVQEGGFVAIGALLGHPPDLMIAMSLATRVRETLPSVPLLIAWQAMEGRAAWARRKAAEAKE